jgi:hypothetical protein
LEFLRIIWFWLFKIFHFREAAGSEGLTVKHQVLWGWFSDRKSIGFETVLIDTPTCLCQSRCQGNFLLLPRFLIRFTVGFLRWHIPWKAHEKNQFFCMFQVSKIKLCLKLQGLKFESSTTALRSNKCNSKTSPLPNLHTPYNYGSHNPR